MRKAPGSSIQLMESMNQGQKIQLLVSFEEAKLNNAFLMTLVLLDFVQILQPLIASK